MATSKTWVIGDVHGCIEQLWALVEKINPGPEDRLVFCGDFLSRGPDGAACVRFAREWGALAVQGNHDRKYTDERPKSNKVRQAHFDALTEDDKEWLRNLPKSLDLGNGWQVIHGDKAFSGEGNLVHGHIVYSSVIREECADGTESWGIDTGCVYGGKLTALCCETREIVQVKGKRYSDSEKVSTRACQNQLVLSV